MPDSHIPRPSAALPAPDFHVLDPNIRLRLAGLAAEQSLIASIDLVDGAGTALLASGSPLSTAMLEAFGAQALNTPLEACLQAVSGVTAEHIVSDCLALVQDSPALQTMTQVRGALAAILRFGNQPLAAPVCLLLTAMRAQQRRRYDKQLAAMAIAAALAQTARLDGAQTTALLLATLLCNLGELYLAPALIENGQAIAAREWAPAAAHAEISGRFLAAFTGLATEVYEGVRQHHERQDGSGYPDRLTGASLGPLAKLAGLADVAAAVLQRGLYCGRYAQAASQNGDASEGSARVVTALSFIDGEFPALAVSFLTQTFAPLLVGKHWSVAGTYAEFVLPVLEKIRRGRLLAEALRRSSASLSRSRAGAFALARLQVIDKPLRGFELYDFACWYRLEHEPLHMGSACLLLDEASWRLHDLARAIALRHLQEGGPVREDPSLARLVDVLDERFEAKAAGATA